MTRKRPPADVTVVGAGPAGLTAAAAAAERGKRVLLLDQTARPGGQIWRHRDEATLPTVALAALARARAAGVYFVDNAPVIDVLSPTELVVDFRGRIDRLETATVVLATGARERFLPFPGWTLPGVTGVGGLQALLKGGADIVNARVVIAGTGPLLFAVASTVAKAGARLVVVAEQAPGPDVARFARRALTDLGRLASAMRFRAAFLGTSYRTDSWVTRADGDTQLRSVTLRSNKGEEVLACDWAAVSAGLIPVVDVAQLLGCTLHGGAVAVDHAQRTTISNVWAAGECTGIGGDAAARVEGEIAGRAAAGDHAGAADARLVRGRDAGRAFASRLAETFAPRRELLTLADDATIVCRCEDVTRGALCPEWSQRQAKLWTRVGMGACQGAVCGPACSAMFGWELNSSRPPLGAPTTGAWLQGLGGPG